MTTYNASNIPEHLQGFETHKQNARELLDKALQEQGIDQPADQIYINSVNDHTEKLVIHSKSLPVWVAYALLDNERPTISASFSGVFSVAHSFADEHRIDGEEHSIEMFATIAGEAYDQLIG